VRHGASCVTVYFLKNWMSSAFDGGYNMAQQFETGRPNVEGALGHFQPVTFATTTLRSVGCNTNSQGAVAFSEAFDPLALVCFLFRDQVIGKLSAEIDAVADDNKAALSEAERAKREVVADALVIERAECARSSTFGLTHRRKRCLACGSLLWHARPQVRRPGMPGMSPMGRRTWLSRRIPVSPAR
jgi:hypothetical protein